MSRRPPTRMTLALAAPAQARMFCWVLAMLAGFGFGLGEMQRWEQSVLAHHVVSAVSCAAPADCPVQKALAAAHADAAASETVLIPLCACPQVFRATSRGPPQA